MFDLLTGSIGRVNLFRYVAIGKWDDQCMNINKIRPRQNKASQKLGLTMIVTVIRFR